MAKKPKKHAPPRKSSASPPSPQQAAKAAQAAIAAEQNFRAEKSAREIAAVHVLNNTFQSFYTVARPGVETEYVATLTARPLEDVPE